MLNKTRSTDSSIQANSGYLQVFDSSQKIMNVHTRTREDAVTEIAVPKPVRAAPIGKIILDVVSSLVYPAYKVLEKVVIKFLLSCEGESAHDWTIALLKFGYLRPRPRIDAARLKVKAFGLVFPNPVGACAGLDKDAQAIDGVLGTGFGFAEFGTLTPQAQPGNEGPRVFRLRNDEGVINRFGFNNKGHDAALMRFQARRSTGIVGVNLGANKNSKDRVADYVAGIRKFARNADYLAINVSSPNTPGLRDLQTGPALDSLLARAVEARDNTLARTPLLLKISPDLSLAELDVVVEVARSRRIDGIIVSNTTVFRPQGLSPSATQIGGLSGRPLFAVSTWMLAQTYLRVDGAFPLIGVGGIDSAESAWRKIRAGATLIQLYTALIYRGLSLLDEIQLGLDNRLRQAGANSVTEIVGIDARTYAAQEMRA
jgi:dihydroorotate dehydrogenase